MRRIKNTFIPSVTHDVDGVSRSYDLYSRLLKDRIIMLTRPIDSQEASNVVMQLLILESESKNKPISIYINSPGGDVYAFLSIIDTMQCLKCEIITVGFGLVASAAAVILACGTRGSRFALPNTRIMIHQPHGNTSGGQVTDIEIQTKEFLFLKNNLTEMMAKRSVLTPAKIKDLMERDKYCSVDEALKIGLIDKVIFGDFDDKSKIMR